MDEGVIEEGKRAGLVSWDYLTLGVYFLVVISAAIYANFVTNRGTVRGYFLAGQSMTWLPVGASIFGSNIGSEHFVGLAGDAAALGISTGAFELNGICLLQLMGFLFVPVYMASGVCTLPEYMMKRFGGNRIRVYLACMSIFVYIVARISVDLYSGALFIQQALQWNQYVAIIAILVFVGLFTLTGGLAAVMYTETVQVFIMVTGGVVLMILSYVKIGGFGGLKERYFQAIPNYTLSTPNYTCGYPLPNAFKMLHEANPFTSDFPWLGFIIGQSMTSMTYFCADQVMVQRPLSAKNLSHAQGGCVLAGFLKLLPLFMIVLPGMIARVLFPDTVACASAETCQAACGNPNGCTNTAFPSLVLGVMPPGLRGLMFAVMLAAIICSLMSFFNSISTLFTVDIWVYFRQKYGHQPSVKELMIVGRLIVVVMVFISILWVPAIELLQGGDGLNRYFTRIAGRILPGLCAVYLLAILWPRANEMGTFWGLVAGALTGFTRIILDFIWPSPVCWEEDNRPYILKMHYFYFNMILFTVVFTVDIVVSLLTEPPPPEMLIRTTYWDRFSQAKRSDERRCRDDYDELVDDDGEEDSEHRPLNVREKSKTARITENLNTDADDRGVFRRTLQRCCGCDDWRSGEDSPPTSGFHEGKSLPEVMAAMEQKPRVKIFIYVMMSLAIFLAAFTTLFFTVL
ncbi:sodium/myo-inositol cotransporter 2-like [Diadema setosum]|uniref:sodium/myo-inositol cotransporter 2-like n=1 Tax=Diadema setosum TaxID=31175 RepID=UPI003B3BB50A